MCFRMHNLLFQPILYKGDTFVVTQLMLTVTLEYWCIQYMFSTYSVRYLYTTIYSEITHRLVVCSCTLTALYAIISTTRRF